MRPRCRAWLCRVAQLAQPLARSRRQIEPENLLGLVGSFRRGHARGPGFDRRRRVFLGRPCVTASPFRLTASPSRLTASPAVCRLHPGGTVKRRPSSVSPPPFAPPPRPPLPAPWARRVWAFDRCGRRARNSWGRVHRERLAAASCHGAGRCGLRNPPPPVDEIVWRRGVLRLGGAGRGDWSERCRGHSSRCRRFRHRRRRPACCSCWPVASWPAFPPCRGRPFHRRRRRPACCSCWPAASWSASPLAVVVVVVVFIGLGCRLHRLLRALLWWRGWWRRRIVSGARVLARIGGVDQQQADQGNKNAAQPEMTSTRRQRSAATTSLHDHGRPHGRPPARGRLMQIQGS